MIQIAFNIIVQNNRMIQIALCELVFNWRFDCTAMHKAEDQISAF